MLIMFDMNYLEWVKTRNAGSSTGFVPVIEIRLFKALYPALTLTPALLEIRQGTAL